MKTLTMSSFRKEPGEVIRAVARGGEEFLLTKDGKPVARLSPIGASDADVVIDRFGRVHGPQPLTKGSSLGDRY